MIRLYDYNVVISKEFHKIPELIVRYEKGDKLYKYSVVLYSNYITADEEEILKKATTLEQAEIAIHSVARSAIERMH